MTIDEIFIQLGLKTDGVKKGMKDAENTISQGISSITSKLSALGAAFTAAMSVGVAWNQYIKEADALGKLANALDVDIAKLDAWGEAAARSGGSAEAFQGSLQALSGQLARTALTGSSRAKAVLEGAGIDAGEVGRQREAFDVLMDLAAKAETMSKSEFFGLGRSLGLDTGTIMLLQQGRQGVKDLVREMKEYGVYDKEAANLTATFNDNMANLGKVFRMVAGIVFKMVLPVFNKLIETANKILVFLRKNENFVKTFFIMIATLVTGMLIPAFAKLAAVLFANPLTWIIATLAVLALTIEDLVGWVNGAEAEFGDLWAQIFESPDKAKEIWNTLKTYGEQFFNLFKANAPSILSFWELFRAGIELSFAPLLKIKAGIDVLRNGFIALSDVIKTLLVGALNTLKAAWDNTIGKLQFPSFSGFSASTAMTAGGTSSYTGNTDNSTHDATYNITNNITAQDGRDAGNQFANSLAAFNTSQANAAYG